MVPERLRLQAGTQLVQFADHLPLYRLEEVFAREGFQVTRGTMCQWMTDVADLVKPVYDVMVQEVKASHVTTTADTIMPLLAPEKTQKSPDVDLPGRSGIV